MPKEKENSFVSYDELFSTSKSWPFQLLLILLLFSSFRPDKLLPGGGVLTYLPTILKAILIIRWLPLHGKVLKNTQTVFYFLFLLLMVGQLPFVRNFGLAKATVEPTLIYGITTYLLTIQFIDTFPRLNLYIRLYAILGAFLAIQGLLSGGKVYGVHVLGDENDFALYVNCLIPFAFFLSQEVKQPRKKLFYYGLIAVYVAANVASFSRGGFVGLVAMGGFLFFQTKRKGMYVVILSIAAGAIISFAPPQYLAEIRTINTQSHKEDTGTERLTSWDAGWRMFKDNPIFGVGVNNYGPWLPEYWGGERAPHNMWGRVAHSLYFTLLSELGIVGTLIFFGMLYGNYKNYRFVSRLEKDKVALLETSNFTVTEKEKISSGVRTLYYFVNAYNGAMVAYLATGIFISVLWYPYFWKLTAFYVMTRNLALRTEKMLVSAQIQKA